MDRELQKSGRFFAGIKGVGMEDHAVQESAGRIAYRWLERLETNDTDIIKARRCILNACKANQEGKTIPALEAETHHVRAAAVLLPVGLPFQEGAQEHLKLTETEFEAV